MVKVQFKNSYENVYGGKEYTYNDYENAAVGDIVVVNTQSGYAIAKVSQIDITDYKMNPDKLAFVEKVIVTQKELDEKEKAEYEKHLKIAKFLENAKRKAVIEQLSNYAEDKETKDLFAKLTNSELESIYKALLK